MFNQKGFAPIFLVFGLLVLIIIGTIFYLNFSKANKPSVQPQITKTISPVVSEEASAGASPQVSANCGKEGTIQDATYILDPNDEIGEAFGNKEEAAAKKWEYDAYLSAYWNNPAKDFFGGEGQGLSYTVYSSRCTKDVLTYLHGSTFQSQSNLPLLIAFPIADISKFPSFDLAQINNNNQLDYKMVDSVIQNTSSLTAEPGTSNSYMTNSSGAYDPSSQAPNITINNQKFYANSFYWQINNDQKLGTMVSVIFMGYQDLKVTAIAHVLPSGKLIDFKKY